MARIKAVTPKLVVHYLEMNPDNRDDKSVLDNLLDMGWKINKSEEKKKNYLNIKALYEKLL
jgi:hypothetical protein